PRASVRLVWEILREQLRFALSTPIVKPGEGPRLPRFVPPPRVYAHPVRTGPRHSPAWAALNVPAAHGKQSTGDLRRKLRFRGSEESRASAGVTGRGTSVGRADPTRISLRRHLASQRTAAQDDAH